MTIRTFQVCLLKQGGNEQSLTVQTLRLTLYLATNRESGYSVSLFHIHHFCIIGMRGGGVLVTCFSNIDFLKLGTSV